MRMVPLTDAAHNKVPHVAIWHSELSTSLHVLQLSAHADDSHGETEGTRATV